MGYGQAGQTDREMMALALQQARISLDGGVDLRVVVGEAQTFAGDLGFLSDRGVDVVLLDDEGCMAAMQEFQTRYPQIWSEDIGGR